MVKGYSFQIFLCTSLAVVLNYFPAFAQVHDDLEFITTHNVIAKHISKENFSLSFDETSELKIICMGMIRFYQLFVSSQQNNQAICTFTPSCSRFGFAAIKKYGPFDGILMTSDRLQRCHGFSRSHYPIHPETGKLFDPIEPYYLRIKIK